jgi:hypothetical protein
LAPAESKAAPLRVPASLAGTEPLELIQFADTEAVYALIGQVRVGEAEYAFFTTGPLLHDGAPIEVYRQTWEGEEAVYLPTVPTDDEAIAIAWQEIQTIS